MNVTSLLFSSCFNQIYTNKYLKNKYIRWFIISLIVLLYTLYFVANFMEVSSLKPASQTPEFENILNRIFVSSFINIIFLIAILIYILISSTIRFNKGTLYMVRSLPFKNNELNKGIRNFYLIVVGVVYFLFLIILLPSFRLSSSSIIIKCLLVPIGLLVCEIIFLLLEGCKQWIFNNVNRQKMGIVNIIINVLLLVFVWFFFSKVRFLLDKKFSEASFDVLNFVIIFSIILVVIFWVLNYFFTKIISDYKVNSSSKNIGIKLFYFKKPNPWLIALFRSRTIILIIVATIISIIASVVTNQLPTLHEFSFYILPVLYLNVGIVSNSLDVFSKMFKVYNITPFKQYLYYLSMLIILIIPVSIYDIYSKEGFILTQMCIISSLISILLHLILSGADNILSDFSITLFVVFSLGAIFFLLKFSWLYKFIIIFLLVALFLMLRKGEEYE